MNREKPSSDIDIGSADRIGKRSSIHRWQCSVQRSQPQPRIHSHDDSVTSFDHAFVAEGYQFLASRCIPSSSVRFSKQKAQLRDLRACLLASARRTPGALAATCCLHHRVLASAFAFPLAREMPSFRCCAAVALELPMWAFSALLHTSALPGEDGDEFRCGDGEGGGGAEWESGVGDSGRSLPDGPDAGAESGEDDDDDDENFLEDPPHAKGAAGSAKGCAFSTHLFLCAPVAKCRGLEWCRIGLIVSESGAFAYQGHPCRAISCNTKKPCSESELDVCPTCA